MVGIGSIRTGGAIVGGDAMEDKVAELIYHLQVQQIDLNEKLMERWTEVGDLIADILAINGKILNLLKEASQPEKPPVDDDESS